ncbi:MAG: LacI family transcriptional regulator [Oscillospiraceae bacterium]|nr:LacI family transcriptional regulator [Oscillospiraceae bacterium]
MATIKDVAREAGVSISTVSKAINGSYTISEEQIKHIKKIAAQMGYKPNARAQTFARKSTRSAVFLSCLDRNTAFVNPHMFEMISGAESSLREKGYSLFLQHCEAKDICHIAKGIIDSKSADGLLIHASVITRELSIMLTRGNIPHIVIGKPEKPEAGNSLCWIDNNNCLAGEVAARYLLELGYKTAVFAGGYETDKISEDRLSGVQNEMKDIVVLRGESSIGDGNRMGLELLSLPERPQVVICANNHLAYGCLQAFRSKNVSIPDGISLVAFDDHPFALFMNPPLTTVSIDVYEMGVQAGKLLVSKIRKPGMQVQSFTTVPTLVARGSTHNVGT